MESMFAWLLLYKHTAKQTKNKTNNTNTKPKLKQIKTNNTKHKYNKH